MAIPQHDAASSLDCICRRPFVQSWDHQVCVGIVPRLHTLQRAREALAGFEMPWL